MGRTTENTVDCEGSRVQRCALIPALQAIQGRYGYIPEAELKAVCKRLNVPLAHAYSVITFYAQFRVRPVGRFLLYVCRGTACHVKGSGGLLDNLTEALGVAPQETNEEYSATVETVACFGACALAPVLVVEDQLRRERRVYGQVTADKLRSILSELKSMRESDLEVVLHEQDQTA
ncbi:NAD(P)H-dependent oxidoreductase subunit E [Coprothermobacteraceae bacterium]|nr:NAD(P)H-dependent oxidoreductase subunit E [Coprothermobacteraceae bacterium]